MTTTSQKYWGKKFADGWSVVQQIFCVIEWGKDLNDFNSYNAYVLAKTDAWYQTDTGRGNLDVQAHLNGWRSNYGSLPDAQRLAVGKQLAKQSGASQKLIKSAKKAANSGVDIIFQLP